MSAPERLEWAVFERLLGIHGSRIDRWPDSAREPLRRLLDHSQRARALWAEAEQLDAWLGAAVEVEPAPALLARIHSLPARHPRPARAAWWPFESSLTPLLGWAAAAVLGVFVGTSDLIDVDLGEIDSDVPAEQASADQGDPDDGADDLLEVSGLVTGADWAAEEE